MRRYDYAVFTEDEYSHNAMLTRQGAAELEAKGLRCIDVEASMDPALPRFRDHIIVRRERRSSPRWHR